MRLTPLVVLTLAACGSASTPPAVPSPPPASPPAEPPSPGAAASPPDAGPAPAAPELHFTATPIPLPGASGAVTLDYIACDRKGHRVWVPAGNTGSVDVLDVASGKFTRIEGFPTAERETHGKRVVGPSSATLGDGVVYVGNRANSQVCAIDATKLTRGACMTLAASPDGMQYVTSTKELWVTTPKDKSITILDASTPAKLKAKTRIALDGSPEGYAVDEAHGLFYTNLEDMDKTLVIDAKTRKVLATWDAQCGTDGPRGIAVDSARGFVFVACTNHVEVMLDVAHAGTLLSKIDTGAGVDNIDFLEARGQLYVAAGKAGALTVARVDDKGTLTLVGKGALPQGARNVVVDSDGTAYAIDPPEGAILAVSSPAPAGP